ncbi:hypothetical protein L596_028228 [Steinernema carpocapsae]|uniref:Uncharacterized protein n=1 Tax=Steinernema carpocapsae TaxID=34508 RepID=A0A4U5LXW1_STECR|nr:hypothetical protein L596_028228 [Steinernema carpocapsae]
MFLRCSILAHEVSFARSFVIHVAVSTNSDAFPGQKKAIKGLVFARKSLLRTSEKKENTKSTSSGRGDALQREIGLLRCKIDVGGCNNWCNPWNNILMCDEEEEG